jgi:hypoxanthine phosphoribosyltransferase
MNSQDLKILFSKDKIESRVRQLAEEISKDYKNSVPVLIGVLKGAFVFMADLIRNLSIPSEVDFVRLASYGASMQSSGKISVTKDLENPVAGRDLLIIEDIVDSGRTLEYLMQHLVKKGARSVKSCVLVDKRERREVPVKLDYVGFVIKGGFVVGYGLDYSERYRHLPHLCILEEEGHPDDPNRNA